MLKKQNDGRKGIATMRERLRLLRFAYDYGIKGNHIR